VTRDEVLHALWEALGRPEEYSDFQEDMVADLVAESAAYIRYGKQMESMYRGD
jgi:hypothetical protein